MNWIAVRQEEYVPFEGASGTGVVIWTRMQYRQMSRTIVQGQHRRFNSYNFIPLLNYVWFNMTTAHILAYSTTTTHWGIWRVIYCHYDTSHLKAINMPTFWLTACNTGPTTIVVVPVNMATQWPIPSARYDMRGRTAVPLTHWMMARSTSWREMVSLMIMCDMKAAPCILKENWSSLPVVRGIAGRLLDNDWSELRIQPGVFQHLLCYLNDTRLTRPTSKAKEVTPATHCHTHQQNRITASVKCPFTFRLFRLFGFWQGKKLTSWQAHT